MADIVYGRDYPEAPWIDRDGQVLTDDPYADVPPPHEPPGGTGRDTDEPTTWEPLDLGPYLRGEIERPEPSLGITRSDGQRFLYPGREHTVVGETECGKSWFALACVAAELAAGKRVLYVHLEEPDAGSTIERLLLLGVDHAVILARLRFVGPSRPVQAEWLAALLNPPPTLVVLDGVNEGMALHGADQDTGGWASFRRRLILPCLKVGAAILSCDHVPMSRDGTRRDAYGTVHKGNTLDGARIALENMQPFGERMRGVSHVFVTKDRPGQLRAHGKSTKTAGKTYFGTLVVDASQEPDFSLRFYAPKADEKVPESDAAADLAATVHDVITALPDHTVSSMRLLFAGVRQSGAQVRDDAVRDAVADLVLAGRLTEVAGTRGARGYKAVLTASRDRVPASPLRGVGRSGTQSQTDDSASASDAVGRSGTQSTETDDDDTSESISEAISVVSDQLGGTTISTERTDR